MSEDYRTDLKVELNCAVCGSKLSISTGIDNHKNKIEFKSAYNTTICILVNPCKNCKKEFDDIKKALKTLKEL